MMWLKILIRGIFFFFFFPGPSKMSDQSRVPCSIRLEAATDNGYSSWAKVLDGNESETS